MGGTLLRARVTLLAAVCAAALCGAPAAAQDEEKPPAAPPATGRSFDVTADSVELDSERDVYVARGNVKIVQNERTLTADWVAFSNTTREGVATGHVVVTEGGDVLYADVLHFNVDDLRGVVYRGQLDAHENEFLMTADEIRRLGPDEYTFENGTFSTCRCPSEDERLPWQIEAERAELEFGGYGTARNTTFDVLGVPILWLPWMRYPLKRDRQTGFLLPEINQSSRAGFGIGVPFFWAARDDVNVTITPSYLTEHGFKPELEIEYVFGEKAWGNWYGSLLPSDEAIDEGDPSTPFEQERWATEWLHDHPIADGWRHKIDARFVSDNHYAFDFKDFGSYRNDRFLEATTFVEKRFGETGPLGLTGEVRYADDLQNPDDIDRDDFLLQRLPDLQLSSVPQSVGLWRTYVSFDVRYTHFMPFDDVESLPGARIVGDGLFADVGVDGVPNPLEQTRRGLTPGFGDPSKDNYRSPTGVIRGGSERDGAFQEGELIADEGHRLVLNPRVTVPLRLFDLVEVTPEAGWYGTFYQTDEQGYADRQLATAQLDVRTRLRKVVDLPFGLERGVHLMEPRVAYSFVSDEDQSDNPLFIPRGAVMQDRIRQLELTTWLRDPADRIEPMSAITLGLGNRLYVPQADVEGVVQPPRLLADISLSLQNDFEEDEYSFYLDGTLLPTQHLRARFNAGWDFDESEIGEALFEFGYADEVGNDFRLGYRLVKDLPPFFEGFRRNDRYDDFDDEFLEIDQIDLLGRYAITRNWAVSYRLSYSLEGTLVLQNELGVEYISRCACWAVRVEVADERARGTEFNLQYRLIGLGDDTVRPFSRHGPRGEEDRGGIY